LLQFAWSVRLPSYVYGSRALRRALVSGVASAVLLGLGNSVNAAPRGAFFSPYGWYGYFSYPADVRSRRQRVAPRRERAEPNKEVGFGEMPKGPLQIVVSIDHQRVTLFSNGARVAQGPVSTGVPGHPTPMGVFSVIEKDRYHRSNLYSNAPMPFMQRITWSGVALHEGVLPGYPASHGCIRMSRDFAQKLWPTTQLGARVVIARGEPAPVDFEHPKLFVPKPKPEPQVAGNEPQVAGNATTTDGRDVAQIAVAPAMAPGVRDDASLGGAATDERGNAERTTPSSQPIKAAEDGKAAASMGSAEASDPTSKVMAAEESLRPADAAAPRAPADSGDTSAQPRLPEVAPAGSDGVKPAPTIDPAKPNAPRPRSADQPAKRSGQVAVFVSRKEKKMFVRQGFVPLFDVPVAIEEPDQPLGTHVLTALEVTDKGMRWNLMTIPTDPSAPAEQWEGRKRKPREPSRPAVQLKSPSTAAEALDRIRMPQDAVDRISELLIPGSSLLISDEGLGRETGRYTEFIVLSQ
jgi:lipoprotein-anchoring transpeptidase ErfK/SrfK